MLSNFIIRSTAAFGGTPFRLRKCTALSSAGAGAGTGDELINSCPSRYNQTASEKMNYLKELAVKDKEAREKAAAAAKEKEERDRLENENKEFQSRLLEIFK